MSNEINQTRYQNRRYHSSKQFFLTTAMCMGESYLLGMLHILTLYVVLPSDDGLKQSSWGVLALLDPFIVTIMLFVCFIIGLLATPVALLLFWKKNILKVSKILFGTCAATTILFTAFGTVTTVFAVSLAALITSTSIFFLLENQKSVVESLFRQGAAALIEESRQPK